MRINELLIESQQLDEGPFTQAIGKVGGKIAKGVANIGKDLKTGFKAGYSGEQPPVGAAPAADAPVKKAGGGFIDQFKKGFAQGRGEPAAEPAAPAATTSAPAATAAPAANPEAEKAAKIGVGQINKIIPTLRTRDLMSLKKNLDTVIAKKSAEKPAAAAPTAAPAGPNWDEETGAPLSAKAKAEYQTFSPEQKAEIQKNIKNKSAAKQNVAASQAEIDADRDRLLPQNSSVIRTGASLSETLARKVQEQRQRMFETALMSGTQSVFKK